MPTTHTVNVDAFGYTGTFGAKLRNPDTIATLVATADTVVASGTIASRFICTFGEVTVIPAGEYLLEFIVNGVSYILYVTLTGIDGEVALARSERSSAWTSEQVTYALSQLALLEMNGNSVVIPAGTYMCARGDIEQVFGTVSVAAWADLNNTGDADEITARINYRIVMADNFIRSVLDNGPWVMPVEGDSIPSILVYNTAALAGVYLYEARGVKDYNPQGFAQHQLSYHKKNVEDFLKGVLVGSISLKPLAYSITSAAPEAS